MESITSVKVFHGSEVKSNGKVIRWTEVRTPPPPNPNLFQVVPMFRLVGFRLLRSNTKNPNFNTFKLGFFYTPHYILPPFPGLLCIRGGIFVLFELLPFKSFSGVNCCSILSDYLPWKH